MNRMLGTRGDASTASDAAINEDVVRLFALADDGATWAGLLAQKAANAGCIVDLVDR